MRTALKRGKTGPEKEKKFGDLIFWAKPVIYPKMIKSGQFPDPLAFNGLINVPSVTCRKSQKYVFGHILPLFLYFGPKTDIF